MPATTPAYTGMDAARYTVEGFLTAPSVLSPQRLQALRAESDRILTICAADSERHGRRIAWEVDRLTIDERAGMDGVIRKVEPVSDLSPIFAALACDPAITGPVAEIFGEPVELFEDKLNLKLPGGSAYPWHQDWSCCWRSHTDELITCFIYLDDADDDNGCLQVVPGSHTGRRIYPFRTGSRYEVDPESFDRSQVVTAPLRAGDMIFFDPYLLHYSARNRSRVPRRAIIYTYNPARLGRINDGRFPSHS